MARGTFKNCRIIIKDATAGTLRVIPMNSLSIVGITYDEQDLTAWQDAVKNALPTMPDAPIEFGGPFDDSALAAVPTLSGSHTLLNALNGVVAPVSVDVQFGMDGGTWEALDPQFGITCSATSGYILTKYVVDPASMMYSARLVLYPGSALPAWGTAAET